MHNLDLMEMEVLREIGTIAASYGSDALTKMLNKEIKVHMPEVLPLQDEDIQKRGGHADEVISVQCDILAGLNGKLLLAFDEKSAIKFLKVCYSGYPLSEGNALNEMGISALKEVGNIVLSSYVTALSVFLRSVVVPSPPAIAMGSFADILKNAMVSQDRIYVLLIEAMFEKEQEQIRGRMGFLITADDRKIIQKSCKESLEKNRAGDLRGPEFFRDDGILDR